MKKTETKINNKTNTETETITNTNKVTGNPSGSAKTVTEEKSKRRATDNKVTANKTTLDRDRRKHKNIAKATLIDENGEVIEWVDNDDIISIAVDANGNVPEPYEGPDEDDTERYQRFVEEEELQEEKYFEDKCKARVLNCEREYRMVIRMWLERVPFAKFVSAVEKRVIGQENVKAVCYNVYHYLELISRGSKKSLPFILAAPSGCGKSETYRAIKEYFENEMKFLSVSYVDASELTEAGFKGNNPETVVGSLLDVPNSNGIGIIFLDEMDKKIMPSYTSGGQNVNAAVQHGLLTIIEGREVSGRTAHRTIDTNNTLFIAMGAFDFLRKEKEDTRAISFGRKVEKREHFSDITREEMLEAGALNEFVGRFHTIINYHKLTDDAVRRILRLNIDDMSAEFGVSIRAEENFLEAMCAVANGKFGCRTLKNILRDRVQALDMELKFSGRSTDAITLHLDENGDYISENEMEQPA